MKAKDAVEPHKKDRLAFLTRAKQRFHLAAEAESANRAEAIIDLKFLNLDQWPDGVKSDRETAGRERPCLTIDQINEPKRQIVNRVRQSVPGQSVRPVGNGADEVTAEIFEGLMRHIGTTERAKTARVTAFDSAVSIGWGYYRLLTEYEHDETFDQEIVLQTVENPLTVYLDPSTRQPDRRDMKWAFIIEDLTKEDYAEQYPDSELASLADFRSLGDDAPDWLPNGGIRVAEYFYVEQEKDVLVQLSTGQTLWKRDAERMLKDLEKAAAAPVLPGAPIDPVPTVLGERDVMRQQVKWCKMNAVEVLEGNEKKSGGRDWPGKYIPIIPVFGEQLNIDGQRVMRGIVRPARDPQRMYNYQNSALVETLALAPKAPWVGAEGQFEDHEPEWNQANTRNFGFLEYKPVTLGGNLAPPPQRSVQEPAIQAIVLSIQQSRQDIRTTTAFYDASDPTQANSEQSGKAIQARLQQSQSGSVNYSDNLVRAMGYEGIVLLELIPRIYDRPGRVIRVLGLEDQVREVMIGAHHVEQKDGPPKQVDEKSAEFQQGLAQFYDLDAGTYDVVVTVGGSFATRRQEAFEMMARLVEAQPALMPIIGDLIMKNSDMPGHEEIAERLKKMLPPQLQEHDGAENVPPQIQAQMQQMQGQLQEAQGKLQQAAQIIQTKQVETAAQTEQVKIKAEFDAQRAKADNDTRVLIAKINATVGLAATQAKVDAAQAKLDVDADMAHLDMAIQATDIRLDHERQMAAQQQAAQQAQQDAGLQQQQMGQDADLAREQMEAKSQESDAGESTP